MGLSVSSSAGKLHLVTQRVGLDKRTGEIIERPATQYRDGDIAVTPDPGWNYNPGAGGPGGGTLPPLTIPPPSKGQRTARNMGLAALPPGAAAAGLAATSGRSARETIVSALAYQGVTPISITRPADGKKDALYYDVPGPADLGSVQMTESVIDKVLKKGEEERERWARFVVPTLRDPGEVWLQEQSRGGRIIYRRVYLGFYPEADMLVLAQEEPKTGWLLWNYYKIRDAEELDRRRAGKLLYRKKEGE